MGISSPRVGPSARVGVKILFLDLATNTGWAIGDSGTKPLSGAWVLGRGGLGPGMLARNLVALKREHGLPDLIGVEKWMAVNAQRSDRNIETSLRLDGAVHAVAGVWGVPVAELDASTIRAMVCGGKSGIPNLRPGMSENAIKDARRKATKQMVVDTMILLGLLPTGCKDDNRADAACGWRYCEAVYGRMAPKDFVLL